MKINKKLLISLSLLTPFLFACAKGESGGGGVEPELGPEYEGLKFTAIENSTIGYSITGEVDTTGIQYSLDEGANWTVWDDESVTVDLAKNKILCIRNNKDTLSDTSNTFNFTMTGKIFASGNISSMINNSEELSDYCFQSMFKNCTALTSAPKLPFYTLAEGCYENMFDGCTSLTSTPKLPATTLKNYCYYSMFDGCTSLKVKEDDSTDGIKIFTCPEISNLPNSVKYMFATTDGSFSGTPNIGSAYYWYIDESEPIEEFKGLKFTATEANSIISYSITGTVDTSGIQYSRDKGITWRNWTYDSNAKKGESIILNNGKSLCVRNTNNTLSTDENNCFKFTMTGEVAASGNVNSMINGEVLSDYCYYNMFYYCTSLISAPELPATTLEDYCYYRMFEYCLSLKSISLLPAKIMKKGCYQKMFMDCESLAELPDDFTLSHVTDLAESCFEDMFSKSYGGGTGLTSLPDGFSLPLVSLEKRCYASMFSETKLTTLPDDFTLPTTTLVDGCYFAMFYRCKNLVSLPDNFKINATSLADQCCYLMFNGCTSLTINNTQKTGGHLIFECPDLGDIYNPVAYMFKGTIGEYSKSDYAVTSGCKCYFNPAA